ncbi:MAG: hypothetical protein Q4E07_04630, partial [Eubacteriales bacterium]|nr:hypothetical protein [Eubacteriales bacterium]
MKNRRTHFISILIIVSLLLGLFVGASAQQALPQVGITASWSDEQGNVQQLMAQPVGFSGYENAYWLYLPPDAVQADATLDFVDNYGQYPGGFTQPSGTPLSMLGFVDAGADLSQQPVYFQALDANGMPVADFMLYISTQAQMPAPPAVQNAFVTVYYVDRTTNAELLQAQTVEIAPETSQTIQAQQIENYAPE